MIIASISFAILAAVAAEFSYSTQVDLAMAANTRDDTRAHYLAKSGLGLARLMLSFQKQVDSIKLPPGIGDLLSQFSGAPPPAAGAAGAPPASGGLNLQLYKLLRVDCYMLQSMVGPEAEREAREELDKLRQVKTLPTARTDAEAPDTFGEGEVELDRGPKSFGGFDGCFDVKIDDPEETKINLNGLDFGPEALPGALATLSAKELEFLFEREDSNGVKVTPQELLINIHDWTDQDKVQSSIDLLNAATPFQKGFSDENYGYSQYEPRYESKNAWFDSLEELALIHGVNDRTMAALRHRFTVYSDPNSFPNINTDDELLLLYAIVAAADPAKNPRLLDPLFRAELIQAIRLQRAFSFLGSSAQDFINVLQSKGLVLKPGAAQKISDKASTYTLHINAQAGGVSKKVTAVVRMDQGALGRLVYWREE